jgi:hypothetical protein
VTIVAAFQCADGILMCADTEETIWDVAKCECDKLRCFRICNNGFALCGGAGTSGLIELVWHRLHQDMFNQVYDWSQIEGVLNGHAMEIFDKHIGPYEYLPEHQRPTLVACRSEFVTADTAGGVRVFPLDRPSIGRVSVDVASEFAS